jgi:hypothetical protein
LQEERKCIIDIKTVHVEQWNQYYTSVWNDKNDEIDKKKHSPPVEGIGKMGYSD